MAKNESEYPYIVEELLVQTEQALDDWFYGDMVDAVDNRMCDGHWDQLYEQWQSKIFWPWN